MKAFLILILQMLSGWAFCQASDTIYLDSRFRTSGKDNYEYYRVASNAGSDRFKLLTYYKSGELREEGISSYATVLAYDGVVTTYWPNGKQKYEREYERSRLSGTESHWYENGKKKLSGTNERLQGNVAPAESELLITDFWSDNGKKTVSDGNGHYDSSDEDFIEKGEIKNRKRVGKWKGYDCTLDLSYEEEYDDFGKLISGTSKHVSGAEYAYTAVNETPQYPGGYAAFYRFVAKNYRTPYDAPSGKIAVSFVVEKDGTLSNVAVVKSLAPEADAEALRVFQISEKWIPGKSRGYSVRTSFTLPITLQVAE